jgi:hypothetical protein
MAGMLLDPTVQDFIVPSADPTDQAVAWDFQRFDGLSPLYHPGGQPNVVGSPSRPGLQPPPDPDTPGPRAGLPTPGCAEPLPVADPLFRPPGDTTYAPAYSTQFRKSVGQNYQGVAQTAAMNQLYENPPVADPISSIIGVYG